MSLTDEQKRELVQAAAEAYLERDAEYHAILARGERARALTAAFIDGVQWCATRLMVENVTEARAEEPPQ